MPSTASTENILQNLSNLIPQIFQDCQKTSSTHRKNAINLRKLQLKCSAIAPSDPSSDMNGESQFNKEFTRNLNKILTKKRGQKTAEYIVKFVVSFVTYSQEKEREEASSDGCVNEDPDDYNLENSLSSRFTEYLLRYLLQGVKAKDKVVRYRVCQLISYLINLLRTLELQGDELSGDEITQKLLEIMQNDSSPEVRRSVLSNLDLTETTLPFILERAKDVDSHCRRSVYQIMEGIGDFRALSINDREKLLTCGLKDRKTCSKMLSTKWLKQVNDDLLQLLNRLDVVRSNIAQEVLLSIFKERPDLLKDLRFEDNIWDELTAEKIFFICVFCEYHKEDASKLDELLPEVTRFAFYLQKYHNCLIEAKSDIEQTNYEFIVTQFLLLAKLLDYGDEIGRRKMHSLLGEILMLPTINENHIDNIIEIIKKISLNEKDFTCSMAEIILNIREGLLVTSKDDDITVNKTNYITLRDEADEIDSLDYDEMEVDEVARNDNEVQNEIDHEEKDRLNFKMINMKCLRIIQSILEKIGESLRNNPSTSGFIDEVIIPNTQSKDPDLREMTKSLMMLFDIFMTFGYTTITKGTEIPELINDCLKSDVEQIQAIAVEGIAKLMLTKLLQDKDILQKLVYLYFGNKTIENIRLRQCLSYFFPVFCHSAYENLQLMQQIFIPTILNLLKEHKNSKGYLTPPLQISQQMIDWIDPYQVVKLPRTEENNIDYGLHADIAINIIKEIYLDTNSKLQINETAGIIRFRKLTLIAGNLKSRNILSDTVAKNALNKFESNLLKYFEDAPNVLDDEELEMLRDIHDFINDVE
nr:9746_t:CDS:10 [Entrophospora candida]